MKTPIIHLGKTVPVSAKFGIWEPGSQKTFEVELATQLPHEKILAGYKREVLSKAFKLIQTVKRGGSRGIVVDMPLLHSGSVDGTEFHIGVEKEGTISLMIRRKGDPDWESTINFFIVAIPETITERFRKKIEAVVDHLLTQGCTTLGSRVRLREILAPDSSPFVKNKN